MSRSGRSRAQCRGAADAAGARRGDPRLGPARARRRCDRVAELLVPALRRLVRDRRRRRGRRARTARRAARRRSRRCRRRAARAGDRHAHGRARARARDHRGRAVRRRARQLARAAACARWAASAMCVPLTTGDAGARARSRCSPPSRSYGSADARAGRRRSPAGRRRRSRSSAPRSATRCCSRRARCRCGSTTPRRSRFLAVNDAAIRHYGYSPRRVPGDDDHATSARPRTSRGCWSTSAARGGPGDRRAPDTWRHLHARTAR